MILFGIFASEAIDKSGEVLKVSGADISDLQEGRGVVNFEHRGGAESTPAELVGKVVYARKLYKPEDATNEHERRCWDKVQLPMIVGAVRLFDDSGHEGAKALAAIIRDGKAHNEPILLGFSIEGQTAARDDRNKQVLASTICRGVAITARPCNASCTLDILQDALATQKSERNRLGGWSVYETADPEVPEDLAKALTAGGSMAAPGAHVQDLEKKAPPKAKSKLPQAKPKAKVVAKPAPKAKATPAPKANAPTVAATPEPEEAPLQFTIRGKVTTPNSSLEVPHFDEKKGILHTPNGSYPAYLPAQDGTEAAYHQLLSHPDVERAHHRAMEGWTRLHNLMREGKLPPEVVMHASLFSMMSPNTPVWAQEMKYSKLIDAAHDTGHDWSQPGGEAAIKRWLELNSPDVEPRHARDHFESAPASREGGAKQKLYTAAGGVGKYGFMESPSNAAANYHAMHSQLTALISKHPHDAQAAVSEMLQHKIDSGNWENTRQSAIARGKPDKGAYPHGPHMMGLAPKTSRYALGMMGGGNIIVNDTHFVRHFYGLEHKVDVNSINYLKSVLDNEHNHEILKGMDRWYEKNHPAVKFMLAHPVWGKAFHQPSDALFPSFWRHWMTIQPHEKMRGMKTAMAANELTTHGPYWSAINPLGKAEGLSQLPLRTAMVHQKYTEHFGDVPAMMLYLSHLAPALIDEGERRMAIHDGAAFLADAHPRLEAAAIDLRAEAKRRTWSGEPRVLAFHTNDGQPLGRVMIHNGALAHLEDHHGALARLLPEGPVDAQTTALLHGLQSSAHLAVTDSPAELPEDPSDGSSGGEVDANGAEIPQTGAIPHADDEVSDAGVYRYRRAGQDQDHILEVAGNTVYLDGTPIPQSVAQLMLETARRGAATLMPGLAKAEGPVPVTPLQHVRAAVDAGHLHPEMGAAMAHHIFADPTAGAPMGNQYAWSEFRKQKRPGVFISAAGNDFQGLSDTHGSEAWGQSIQAVGQALRAAADKVAGKRAERGPTRNPDTESLWRSKGDQFQLHFPTYQHAARFLAAARDQLQALAPVGGAHKLSLSFGVGATPEHAERAQHEAQAQATPATAGHNLAFSLYPGREGSIKLHSEAPPLHPDAARRIVTPALPA